MYKILHIPTACIVCESKFFYESMDNQIYLRNTTLGPTHEYVDGMFISPILFKTTEAAMLYLDAHISYESFQPGSDSILLYTKELYDVSKLHKINNYEFEIIEVDGV